MLLTLWLVSVNIPWFVKAEVDWENWLRPPSSTRCRSGHHHSGAGIYTAYCRASSPGGEAAQRRQRRTVSQENHRWNVWRVGVKLHDNTDLIVEGDEPHSDLGLLLTQPLNTPQHGSLDKLMWKQSSSPARHSEQHRTPCRAKVTSRSSRSQTYCIFIFCLWHV